MTCLVLLRHGESEWNHDGRFAGWIDVPLTLLGIGQAKRAGALLGHHGLEFGLCCTSVLKRATHTAWLCLEAMERTWVPTVRSWRLNERHYGALQGLSKSVMVAVYGQEQVRQWRRSYSVRPPPASDDQVRTLADDPRYRGTKVPAAESLQDAVARLQPFWEEVVVPALETGSNVLMVGHGTSLRAVFKIAYGRSGPGVAAMEIPNGVPLILDIDAQGKVRDCRILSEDGFAPFDS